MLVSRTPLRLSFSGGSLDYPSWYLEHEGAVIGTSINKYSWLTVRELPPFFNYKYRIVWSQIELTNSISEIQHPSVRACLSEFNTFKGLEIHHAGDLPARSGLGSSSSFTVGLLNALYTMKGIKLAKHTLASQAIHIEQNIIKENVGSQDQTFAAYGGFNYITFTKDGIEVRPVNISISKLSELQSSLMLFFTGIARTASEVAAVQIKEMPNKTVQMKNLYELTERAKFILEHNTPINEFGELLGVEWKVKKSLSPIISNPKIDEIEEIAMRNGAIGLKLCGAGFGGFMLLYVPEKYHNKMKEALKDYLYVPFQFETKGSEIIA